MRPVIQIVGSVTSGPWIILDQYTPTFNVNLNVQTGGSTCQVDYTDDDPFNVSSPAVHGQAVASGSTNSSTGLTVPHKAVRLTVTVFVAAATLKVTQVGLAV
jgi:hypothetical protein